MTKKNRDRRKRKRAIKRGDYLAAGIIPPEMFYGMSLDMYKAGYRFGNAMSTHQEEHDNKGIKPIHIRWQLLRHGQPVVIHHDRPNIVAVLTGINE